MAGIRKRERVVVPRYSILTVYTHFTRCFTRNHHSSLLFSHARAQCALLLASLLPVRTSLADMGDPIESFLATYNQTDSVPRIPEPRAICCCGSEACAYLKHNQTALDGLERDVSTAARLGKVRD